ncbi:hypothetical protein E2562_023396 [Oryza meyeriana var. granulata]|uniref:Uncharacterized protein n=1 Tax=Oryza meyeriana var. granulata TaxID=110450 RepID=A0A6G1DZM3_9ORYZ|nr:hypothetical protein E2562_023396 [Oryza meyeriana var. granulata]
MVMQTGIKEVSSMVEGSRRWRGVEMVDGTEVEGMMLGWGEEEMAVGKEGEEMVDGKEEEKKVAGRGAEVKSGSFGMREDCGSEEAVDFDFSDTEEQGEILSTQALREHFESEEQRWKEHEGSIMEKTNRTP